MSGGGTTGISGGGASMVSGTPSRRGDSGSGGCGCSNMHSISATDLPSADFLSEESGGGPAPSDRSGGGPAPSERSESRGAEPFLSYLGAATRGNYQRSRCSAV